MTNAIDRKTAEAAKLIAYTSADDTEEYRAAVATWNAFCSQERARIARAPKPPQLSLTYRLFGG